MPTKREELLAEQERIRQQLAKLDEVALGIIPLENYTDQQKIDYFDSLYKMASDTVKEIESSGYDDDDNEHWFYEMGMSVLNLGDDKALWKYINSLT